MAIGRKTGGRVAGTPNRRSLDTQQLLSRLDCNPIEGMARIAMNSVYPVEIRARMYAELAQYVAPKRKSVELGASEEKITFNIGIPIRQSAPVGLNIEHPARLRHSKTAERISDASDKLDGEAIENRD